MKWLVVRKSNFKCLHQNILIVTLKKLFILTKLGTQSSNNSQHITKWMIDMSILLILDILNLRSIKSVRNRSFFGSYSGAFRLNTKRNVSPNTETFHAVLAFKSVLSSHSFMVNSEVVRLPVFIWTKYFFLTIYFSVLCPTFQ